MSKPIAYFNYSKNGKVLTFRDLSLNAPTSYAWDFGDGGTSTSKEPTHTYTSVGYYQVSLIATNIDGSSDPLIVNIGIGETNDQANVPLLQMVNDYIPDAILGFSTNSEKVNSIQKWQSYLQPLVCRPFKVPVEQTHNEFYWPMLVNNLIGMLVAYDLLNILVTRAMSSIITGSISSEDGSTGTTSNDKSVKKITTGPTEVEFNSLSEQGADSSKAVQNIFDNKKGIINSLKESICNLSMRVGIYLAQICERQRGPVIQFVTSNRIISYGYRVSGIFFPIVSVEYILGLANSYNQTFDDSGYSKVDEAVDIDSEQSYYYCGFNYLEDGGSGTYYRIFRFSKLQLGLKVFALVGNNPGYPNFSVAWTNRAILTYTTQ